MKQVYSHLVVQPQTIAVPHPGVPSDFLDYNSENLLFRRQEPIEDDFPSAFSY